MARYERYLLFALGVLVGISLDRVANNSWEGAILASVVTPAVASSHVKILQGETPSPSELGNLQATKSAFDEVVAKAYSTAFPQPPPKTTRRDSLNFATWKRGTGGLNDKDRSVLAKIYGSASSLFEWGLGESTFIASHVGVPRYAGIDSDAVWVGKARDSVLPHFRFYLADIGKTKPMGFGHPIYPNLTKSLLDYQVAPLIVEPEAFDVYMVDGRMRIACVLVALLHASARGGPTPTILMHDCVTARPKYHVNDDLLDLESTPGSQLCVYHRKQNTTDAQLLERWNAQNKASIRYWDR